MEQDELQHLMGRYDGLLEDLMAAGSTPTAISALSVWASATHAMVKTLLEVMQKQQELLLVTGEFIKESGTSHRQTHNELEKLDKLQQQFEAMQEMFGTKLAQVHNIPSPPPLSVIKGDKDDA